MRHHSTLLFTCLLLLIGCQPNSEEIITGFEVYCEMVANDAKPVALSAPMDTQEMEKYWDQFQEVARTYEVDIYKETEFPITPLFPPELTKDKEVLIVHRGFRLTQYLQFKEDLSNLEPEKAARRLGRLLGYTPQGVNALLMKNTKFRTLEIFDVDKQVTHLYYDDVSAAVAFYDQVLSLEQVLPGQFKIGADAWIHLHGSSEDHPSGQPKSTAIALLTDQLPEWYTHIQKHNVPIKYTYKPREGGPHDGFVAIDPGGYLLEFEEFKQHPENELFIAALAKLKGNTSKTPGFYGSITWTYHNDLLKMQQFYEEELGFRMVADQGWTKIYQTSSSGFIGLVDERRGMMDYADEKAIEIEWQLANTDKASAYFSQKETWDSTFQGMRGPENYRYLIR